MCPIAYFRSSLNKHLTETLNEILIVVEQSQQAGLDNVKVFVREQLAAASHDIFVEFETALKEYQQEIERQRRLLDIVLKPFVKLHRTDSQHLIVCKDEPQSQQERPEATIIKEEQEHDLRICEFLGPKEADIKGATKTFDVKSENDEERGSSHPNSIQTNERSTSAGQMEIQADREDCGLSEADSHLPSPGVFGALGKCQPLPTEWSESETEIRDEWTETGQPQTNFDTLGLQKTQGAEEQDLSDNSRFRRCQKLKSMAHELKSTNQMSSSTACKVCGKSFHRKRYLMSHVKIHSRGCGFCGKQFDSEQSLRLHSKIHITCSICNKTFSTVSHFNKHIQVHNPQNISCAVCKLVFADKAYLKTHMRRHTGERPFSCTVCNKRFTQSGSIKTHMRCHSGEKPFRCTVCDKSFTQTATLKAHMRRHTGERPFSCTVCNKRFTQSGSIKTHMRRHTGEKPFRCTICKKGFTYSGTLTGHMKCHTKVRPFSCTLCKKTFIAKNHLTVHMRIHTEERPFSCAVCNDTFIANCDLKNHMKHHSALEQFIGLASPYVTKGIDII